MKKTGLEIIVLSEKNGLRLIALFTVNSSHLHYNIFAPGCEAISGKNCKIARNCLTSKFKNIVMQMRKGNREKGYWLSCLLSEEIYKDNEKT